MDDILPKKQVLSTQQTAREGPAFLLSVICDTVSVICNSAAGRSPDSDACR